MNYRMENFKNNSTMLAVYYTLVEKTNCRLAFVFVVVSPSICYFQVYLKATKRFDMQLLRPFFNCNLNMFIKFSFIS